jgi:mannosyl-oligosaccharide glucosidase
MGGYGWSKYDPRVGGSQILHDDKLRLDLTTDFIKGDSGDSWAVRVTGRLRSDAPQDATTAVIFHVALEQVGEDRAAMMKCESKDAFQDHQVENRVACHGDTPTLGAFDVLVTGESTNHVKDSLTVRSVHVSEDKIWQAKCNSSLLTIVRSLNDCTPNLTRCVALYSYLFGYHQFISSEKWRKR